MSRGDVDAAQAVVHTRRYPAFLKRVEDIHRLARKQFSSDADVSDNIVDMVRGQLDLRSDEMWGFEEEELLVIEDLKGKYGELREDDFLRERWRRFLDDALEFQAELGEWSMERLAEEANTIREQKHSARHATLSAQGELEDVVAFFNEPRAQANFQYWSQLSLWTFDEALALSFGKDPSIVTLENLRAPSRRFSPFVQAFKRRAEQLRRAVEAKDLAAPTRPKAFIDWGVANKLCMPDALLNIFGEVHDAEWWKQRYDAERQRVRELESELCIMRREVERLHSDDVTEIDTRSRKSLFRIILAMAAAKYGYRTDMQRHPATKLIVRDLEKVGQELGEGAVHAWLKKAQTELLFQWPIPDPEPKKKMTGPTNR